MNMDILFSGCPRRNTVKQNDVSILCIHKKEKGNVLSQIYALIGKFTHDLCFEQKYKKKISEFFI